MVLLADHHLSLLHVPLHSALYFTTFQIMKSSFKTSRLKHSTSSVKSSHCHYGEELGGRGGGRWAACPWSCCQRRWGSSWRPCGEESLTHTDGGSVRGCGQCGGMWRVPLWGRLETCDFWWQRGSCLSAHRPVTAG